GKTVGKMLAKKLNIPFYNHEIVSMASEESGINAVYFSDERLKPSLIERLRTRGGDTSVLNDSRERYLTDDALFEHQTKVIRRLANEGPCVIVGRCADFVLKGRKDVVRVFVHADDDFCLEQAMLVNSLSVSQVKKKIAEVDEYHAKYYKYHTGKDWYDARNYDLSLNSGVLGFEGTMNEILNYIQVREQAAQE
ncbi:MAG: cytidylate kinase-like family protein, partial [Oscillospiraceae bacterium]|nr:cytidylate kinase-like family protein [Oscillospiraceae bacterium]